MKGGIREKARERYDQLHIDRYGDVYEGDIEVLYMILNRHLKTWTRTLGCANPTIHMSKRVKISKCRNGMIREAYLFVNSFHWTQREAISFNNDGSSGLADGPTISTSSRSARRF